MGTTTWHNNVRPVLIRGSIAIVACSGGGEAIIDSTDASIADGWNWSISKGYAVRGESIGEGLSRKLYLHRLVAGAQVGVMVDHVDGNRLNNRRANLRIVSAVENARNRRPQSNATSRYKGVSFRSDRGTWLAAIRIHGKLKKLGTFRTEAEAAMAYDNAARRAFGSFAFLNFPEKP